MHNACNVEKRNNNQRTSWSQDFQLLEPSSQEFPFEYCYTDFTRQPCLTDTLILVLPSSTPSQTFITQRVLNF